MDMTWNSSYLNLWYRSVAAAFLCSAGQRVERPFCSKVSASSEATEDTGATVLSAEQVHLLSRDGHGKWKIEMEMEMEM